MFVPTLSPGSSILDPGDDWMRRFFSFWWMCAKRAFRGNSAFANDWQWLIGYPATALIIWLLAFWYGGLSGRIELTLSTGAVGALVAAAAAYVITWATSFVAQVFNAPVELYHELQNRLAASSNDVADQRKAFVARAFLGFGPVEIEWLDQMNIGGRPVGCPDETWQQLERERSGRTRFCWAEGNQR
jgi:hypothetical protein